MTDDRIPIIVYAVLAFVLMAPLLGPGYYLSLDMVFGPNTFSDSHFSSFYGYGSTPYGAYMPLKLVLAAFAELLPVEVVQKMLLFLILFLCGVSAHFSLPSEYGNSRYFAGLLYTLNPFVFVRFLAGHWSFLLSYAFWPIAIKFFLDFLNAPKERNNLAKAALFTFLASISSHGVILLLFSYLLLFLFHIAGSDSRRTLVKQTFILAAIVLAMSLFWLVPTVLKFGERYVPVSAEAYLKDFGAQSWDIPLPFAVLTMHGFWRAGFYYTKDVFDLWYIPYLVIAAISMLGLFVLFRENRMRALFLLSLFILGFLLSLGAESPLSWVFTAFDKYLSIGFIFRDSHKFVALMVLAYSLLGACGLHHLMKKTGGRKKALLLAAFLAIPILYNYGFFGFLGQIGPTVFPQEWVEAERIIAADDTQTNILALPLHLYRWYPWVNSTQRTLANPAGKFFSKPVITAKNIETRHIYSDIKDPEGRYIAYMFTNRQFINNTAEMLLPLNVRYIILSKYDPDYIHYLYLFHRKGGVQDIELVFEGPTMYLFRNNLAKSPLIASKENGSGDSRSLLNLSGKGLYSTDVLYEEVTPAYYRILDSPYQYVVFTQDYNSFMEFEGEPVFPWHGLANGFVFSGAGALENRLFYYQMALFLLSWLVAMALIIDASPKQLLSLTALFVALYLITSGGLLEPAAIGILILLSLPAAAVLKCRKKG